MRKKSSPAESAEAPIVDVPPPLAEPRPPFVPPLDDVWRDVALARFRQNGEVDALDIRMVPINELCGHSISVWGQIKPRLMDGARLVLMIHGNEREIDESMVEGIQRWR